MDTAKAEVYNAINKLIRSEAGNRLTVGQRFRDAELDSFGATVVLMELDDLYGIFDGIPTEVDVFSTIDFETFTVDELVELCT